MTIAAMGCWVAALVAARFLSPASGHAYLAEPPSRNLVAHRAGAEMCPHCLQGNGPPVVMKRGGNVWPTKNAPGSHGLCGDPVQGSNITKDWRDEPYLVPTPVQRRYRAGEVVEFAIAVTTHHKGHYEFRICEHGLSGKTMASPEQGQRCLDARLLERASLSADCTPGNRSADCQPIDERHPERWYLPPPNGAEEAGEGLSDGSITSVGEVHRMRFKIPADLECKHCTLQWYWSTGNNCFYDEDYVPFFRKMNQSGWAVEKWCPWCLEEWATCKNTCCGKRVAHNGKPIYGEEFWNCADIAVLPSSLTHQVSFAQSAVGPAPSSPSSAAEDEDEAEEDEEDDDAADKRESSSKEAEAGGLCKCESDTPWDGSFGQFAAKGSEHSFCSQNFGAPTPYISGGGGDGMNGGWSGEEPCATGQYSVTEEEGWKISVATEDAKKKGPFRAFAYLQFCNGKPYSKCWSGAAQQTFSFTFKTEGMEEIPAYVKLLFWTDSGNILGLLPPKHPNGKGKFRLLLFPEDDYPNKWAQEATLQDDVWHHCSIVFTPAKQGVAVYLNGKLLGESTIPVKMMAATNGPQIGVYSFDFAGTGWPEGGFKLWLNEPCIGKSTGACASDAGPSASSGRDDDQGGDDEDEANQPSEDEAGEPDDQGGEEEDKADEEEPEEDEEADASHNAAAPSTELATERSEESPAAASAPSSGGKAKVYQQCGGAGWSGPTVCEGGSVCEKYNSQYHQCVPETFQEVMAKKFLLVALSSGVTASSAGWAAALAAGAVLAVAAVVLLARGRRPSYARLETSTAAAWSAC